MEKIYFRILSGALFLLILETSLAFSQPILFDGNEKVMNTDGDTRGIAVQGYYVYLADGNKGLKIINVSNPYVFVLTGRLPLPGCFIDQVAVDEDVAVLTDTANNRVHFVDVSAKMRPALMGSLDVEGETPRKVVAYRGLAFVVEYGDDPSDPDYFSGIEVFSYETEPASTQLTGIERVRDVAVSGKYLFAAVGDQLHVHKRIRSGFSTTRYHSIDFTPGDNVNSLTLYGNRLFAFGSELYVVTVFTFRFPGPDPFRTRETLLIFIANQISVPGDRENRRVDAAILDYGGGLTSAPSVFVLLTTMRCCGMCIYNSRTNNLQPFDFFDGSTESWISMQDVYEATEGRVQIFDSAFSEYFWNGLFSGGILAFGAIGDYGLGCVQVELRR